MLRECLGNAANSIWQEIEQRMDAQVYLEWMMGEDRGSPKSLIPYKDTDRTPENLKKLGEGVSGTGGLIGHGV